MRGRLQLARQCRQCRQCRRPYRASTLSPLTRSLPAPPLLFRSCFLLLFLAVVLAGLYVVGYYGVEYVESELSDDDGWKYCNGTKVHESYDCDDDGSDDDCTHPKHCDDDGSDDDGSDDDGSDDDGSDDDGSDDDGSDDDGSDDGSDDDCTGKHCDDDGSDDDDSKFSAVTGHAGDEADHGADYLPAGGALTDDAADEGFGARSLRGNTR